MIHVATDRFIPGGGLEHIFQLTRGLSHRRFCVFGEPGPAAEKLRELPNVEVRDKGCSPTALLDGNPDLIHIHHLRPLANLFKNPLAPAPQVPVAFTAHGLHLHKYEFYPGLTPRILRFARFHLEKYLLRRVSQVIAVSREDREYLVQHYRIPDPVYITNGVDGEALMRKSRPEASKQELRQLLRLPEHSFLFLVIARFHFQKGYDILLEAVSRLKERIAPGAASFLLAGDGEEFSKMRDLGESLGLGDWVQFLGSRNDAPELMRAADMLVLPSRWEGLPIVLLEAGLLRLPVAVSNARGNREIITPQTGILFPQLTPDALCNTFCEILQNQRPAKQLAENLFHRVQNDYNLDLMLKKMDNLYRSLGA